MVLYASFILSFAGARADFLVGVHDVFFMVCLSHAVFSFALRSILGVVFLPFADICAIFYFKEGSFRHTIANDFLRLPNFCLLKRSAAKRKSVGGLFLLPDTLFRKRGFTLLFAIKRFLDIVVIFTIQWCCFFIVNTA